MLSILTSAMFFSIDHQSTSNDRLKPVMTTGLVNMHIDRSIANLATQPLKASAVTAETGREFQRRIVEGKKEL